MKLKLIIKVALLFVFALTVSAQKKKTKKPNPPKDTRIVLSFAKPEKMFQILNGKWSFMETNCENPITIKVPADRRTIKVIYSKTDEEKEREYVFVVSEVGRHYIRGQYEDEKRRTADGKLEVWDFMFLSADEFVWHRKDWNGLGATQPATRCKEQQLAFLK